MCHVVQILFSRHLVTLELRNVYGLYICSFPQIESLATWATRG